MDKAATKEVFCFVFVLFCLNKLLRVLRSCHYSLSLSHIHFKPWFDVQKACILSCFECVVVAVVGKKIKSKLGEQLTDTGRPLLTCQDLGFQFA